MGLQQDGRYVFVAGLCYLSDVTAPVRYSVHVRQVNVMPTFDLHVSFRVEL